MQWLLNNNEEHTVEIPTDGTIIGAGYAKTSRLELAVHTEEYMANTSETIQTSSKANENLYIQHIAYLIMQLTNLYYTGDTALQLYGKTN